MSDIENAIESVIEVFNFIHGDFVGTDDFDEQEWQQKRDNIIKLLKEQEEKPLRCKTCTMRDKTGFCHRWNIEVKDDDYCSFGAWKGCYI